MFVFFFFFKEDWAGHWFNSFSSPAVIPHWVGEREASESKPDPMSSTEKLWHQPGVFYPPVRGKCVSNLYPIWNYVSSLNYIEVVPLSYWRKGCYERPRCETLSLWGLDLASLRWLESEPRIDCLLELPPRCPWESQHQLVQTELLFLLQTSLPFLARSTIPLSSDSGHYLSNTSKHLPLSSTENREGWSLELGESQLSLLCRVSYLGQTCSIFVVVFFWEEGQRGFRWCPIVPLGYS